MPSEFIKRPTVNDKEEDLIAMQSEFMAMNTKSAVHIKKPSTPIQPVPLIQQLLIKEQEDINPKVKKSLFAQRMDASRLEAKGKYPKPLIASNDLLFGSVLANVKERVVVGAGDFQAPEKSGVNIRGFPVAMHRSMTSNLKPPMKSSRNKRGKDADLKYSTANFKEIESELEHTMDNMETSKVNDEIHAENIKKLESMSKEEVEEAKTDLCSSLNAKTLAFLKKRAEIKYSQWQRSEIQDKIESIIKPQEIIEVANEIDSLTDIPSNASEQEIFDKMMDSKSAHLEKLAWINAPDESSPDISPRFNFKGEVLDLAESIPTHEGLHHHGNEPNKSGYTILELIHLSKSTVLPQRIIAFQTLGRIVTKIYSSDSAQNNAIMTLLRKSDCLLAIRIGIDQPNTSLVVHALSCLASFLGCYIHTDDAFHFEDVLQQLSLTNHGERALSMSLESHTAFKAKSLGRNVDIDLPEESESLEGILSVLKQDYILGLLSTNILVRFRYLLETTVSHGAKIEIVWILTCFVNHSTSTAEDVLACPGLIDALQKSMFSLPWPSDNEQNISNITSYVRLFRVFAQSSRQACEALLKYQTVHHMMRYLSLLNSESVMQLQIATEVLGTLSICFVYGLGAKILDEYRMLLFGFGKILIDIMSQHEDKRFLRHVYLGSSAFASCIRHALRSFRVQMDAGGPHDAILPLIEYAINSMTIRAKVCGATSFISSNLELLKTYTKMSLTYQHSLSDIALGLIDNISTMMPIWTSQIISQVSIAQNLEACEEAAKKYQNTDHFEFEKGLGIVQKNRLEHALCMMRMTTECDTLSSVFHLSVALSEHLKIDMLKLTELVQNSQVLELVRKLISTTNNDGRLGEHEDWIRFFAQGKCYLLESWIDAVTYLKSKNTELQSIVFELFHPTAVTCVTAFLPGDDYSASRILNEVVFSKTKESLRKTLKEFFESMYFSDDSISYSQSIFADQTPWKPSCLMFQLQDTCSSFPLRLDWIYAPFEQILMKQNDPSNLIPDNILEIVLSLLEFIKVVEESADSGILSQLSAATKLVSLMHVFLLTDADRNEIFRHYSIKELLTWSFEYFSRTPSDLQTAFVLKKTTQLATQSRFYELYQELTEQYIAVSFGDALFSRYLSLPLTMLYPVDYRLHFWTCMMKVKFLRSISWNVEDLPQGRIDDYLNPKETNVKMLRVYASAIETGALTKELNPVLYQIASHHIHDNSEANPKR